MEKFIIRGKDQNSNYECKFLRPVSEKEGKDLIDQLEKTQPIVWTLEPINKLRKI